MSAFHTATTRHDPNAVINKQDGRVSLPRGRIVYSPNCSRDVNIPSLPPGTCPTVHPRSDDVERLYDPLWWSYDTAHLAFLPINPIFNAVPFEELNDSSYRRNEKGYLSISVKRLLRWTVLEHLLRKITRTHEGLIPKIVNPLQTGSAITCQGDFQFPSQLKRQHKRSKGWFSLYSGTLSYIIACFQEMADEGPVVSGSPSWFEDLRRSYDEIILSGIRSSCAVFDPFFPRVGVFIDLMNPVPGQFSVDFLLKYNIPVWYFWGDDERKMARKSPYIARLAPLPHQLQVPMTILTTSPSPIVSTPTTPNSTSLPLQAKPKPSSRPWVLYFEEREKKKVDPIQLQRAQNRMINRPHPRRTKVYEWERDDDGEYCRTVVARPSKNEETLDQYYASQKIYDPYFNDWHCCYAFGEGTHEERLQEKEDFNEFITGSAAGYCGSPLPPPDLPLPDVVPPDSSVPLVSSSTERQVWTPTQSQTENLEPFEAQVERRQEIPSQVDLWRVGDTLYELYGFVPPSPMPSAHPSPLKISDTLRKQLCAVVGVREVQESLEKTVLIQYFFEFVESLAKGSPSNQLYDLAISNPVSILKSARLRCLKRLGPTFVVYHPPRGTATVPWRLAVTNGLDALFLCRLDDNLSDVALCSILYRRGIQFHTLYPLPHIIQNPLPVHIFPTRTRDYKFTRNDYLAYLEERRQLLQNPRIRRGALMSGGILWRLTVETVGLSEILDGPTTLATVRGNGLILQGDSQGTCWVDDQLTATEADLLCGLVYQDTGKVYVLNGL